MGRPQGPQSGIFREEREFIAYAKADPGKINYAPAQFGKLVAEETERWGKLIRAANIKAE